jgi:tol-pal system protein YbgF
VKLSEQVSTSNQYLTQLGQNINALKQSMQEQQKKLQEQERAEANAPIDDPEQGFASAYLKYKNGQYESAINLFRSYLRANDRSEKADDAAYWIAECYAAQGKLPEALREYDDAITRYPDGDKIPTIRFRKAVTLLRLERRQEGVDALRVVAEQYPGSQEATAARAELTRLGEPSAGTSPTPRQRSPR